MGTLTRRGLTAAILLAVGLSAAACAPTRGFDADVAYAWANTQLHAELARGSLGLAVVRTDGTSVSEATALTLPPQSVVSDLRVRCRGGATVRIHARVSGESHEMTVQGLVTCDEKDHLVDLGPASDFPATSVAVWTVSAVETAALVILDAVAVPGDPWAGYFDDDLRNPAASGFAGSFGASGAATAAESLDDALPPGRHVVEVTCTGEATVTVTLSTAEASGAGVARTHHQTTDVQCPASALLELTTEQPGLSIRLTSHGGAGAYLVRTDPGPPAGP